MKKYSPLLKVGALVLMTLIMLIPVSMIMQVIDERHDYQKMVIRDITKSVGGEQVVAGPVIVQPYVKGDILRHKYFLPEQLDIESDLHVENRKLGIYQAQIYKGDVHVKGQFSALDLADLRTEEVTFYQPYLVVAVQDSMGIISIPALSLTQEKNASLHDGENQMPAASKDNLNHINLMFDAGISTSAFAQGVHAMLPANLVHIEKPIQFSFTLTLQGGQRFSIVPLGRNSTYLLKADWPHPNFLGEFLPTDKTITENGFEAMWKSSWFANNINDKFTRYNYQEFNDDSKRRTIYVKDLPRFDTKLVELVDEYQLNERSVKYSILFISLTFVAFFLFEVMKGLRIHPIQYLLVGMALVMFYLVLLALSEHIGFNLAYLAASLICASLITFYLSAVLKGLKRGLVFGAGLLVLYAVLLGLLQLDNIALLLGTVLLFMVLAAIMILTRNLDWYNLTMKVGGGVAEPDESRHQEINETLDRNSCRLWK